MLCGKCRCCVCWKIPGGTARGCWPVQELALLCPERQTDLPALYAEKCYQACVFAWLALSVGGSADAGRLRVGVELDSTSLNESSAAAKNG